MESVRSKRLLSLSFLVIILLIFIGCASMGKYSLEKPPVEDVKSFINIEVNKVEVGITKDELNPETVTDLRAAIIEAIQKKKIYEQIGPELDVEEGTLVINCKIIELDNGSKFLRWLLGMGAGKAYLETACQFSDKKTGRVIASGTFTGEIRGGFFGGSADQEKMAKYVAEAVARFLKKGK